MGIRISKYSWDDYTGSAELGPDGEFVRLALLYAKTQPHVAEAFFVEALRDAWTLNQRPKTMAGLEAVWGLIPHVLPIPLPPLRIGVDGGPTLSTFFLSYPLLYKKLVPPVLGAPPELPL